MPSVLQNYYQNNYKPISQKGLFWGSVMRAQNKVPNFDPMLCTLSVVTQFEFNILKLKKKTSADSHENCFPCLTWYIKKKSVA